MPTFESLGFKPGQYVQCVTSENTNLYRPGMKYLLESSEIDSEHPVISGGWNGHSATWLLISGNETQETTQEEKPKMITEIEKGKKFSFYDVFHGWLENEGLMIRENLREFYDPSLFFNKRWSLDIPDGLSRDNDVVKWFKHKASYSMWGGYAYENDNRSLYNHIRNHWPTYDDEKGPGFVTLWLDEKGFNRGEKGRVQMRAGRAFRKMFPWLDDPSIEKLCESFREDFKQMHWEVVISSSREDFKYAYLGVKTFKSGRAFNCSLTASCMRYNFQENESVNGGHNYPCHPAEFYATCGFEIAYIMDADGKVHARCVLHNDDKYTAIYDTGEKSYQKLRGYLEDRGYTPGDIGDYGGEGDLILLNSKQAIVPYIDGGCCFSIDLERKKVILNGGDYEADCQYGRPYVQTVTCSQCGTTHDLDYEHNGEPWCYECHNDSYVYDEFGGRYILEVDSIRVRSGFASYLFEVWNKDTVESGHAIEVGGSYFTKGFVESSPEHFYYCDETETWKKREAA